MDQVGAFDMETFYPEKERLKLAVALNNILAAPSFSTWISGAPLDLGQMLQSNGKPCQLIFSIAHLDDTQRMFFVALLLEEVLNWTRRQPGTTSLRALLYFDEVFGYLPPHPANPPSKVPLMTLLKQARAFGVGVLLATQNPVDLDYKALSNAGTWFVGKLQTEHDKARLVDGLEGVAAERGTLSDRSYLETVISALKKRIFLLHNVHQPRPIVFQSRWTLSFLRGPMTRDQIALLMKGVKESQAGRTPNPPGRSRWPPFRCAAAAGPIFRLKRPSAPAAANRWPRLLRGPKISNFVSVCSRRPWLGPCRRCPALLRSCRRICSPFYLPLKQPLPAGAELLYQPRVLGFAQVSFVDRRRGLEHRRPYQLLGELPANGKSLSWMTAENLEEMKLDGRPEPNAGWAPVPETVDSGRKLKTLQKAFGAYLYGNARLRLFENRKLALVSEAQEDLQSFQRRCQEAAWREALRGYEAERLRYLPKFNALQLAMPNFAPERPGGEKRTWRRFAELGVDAFPSRGVGGESGGFGHGVAVAEAKGSGRRMAGQGRDFVREVASDCRGPHGVAVDAAQGGRRGERTFGLAWAPFGRIALETGGRPGRAALSLIVERSSRRSRCSIQ